MKENQDLTRSSTKLIIIYLLITILVLLTGIRYYYHQKEEIRNDRYSELSVVSDLKRKQILNWRMERIGDAFSISQSKIFTSTIVKWFSNPLNMGLRDEILSHLIAFKNSYNYNNIFIFDTSYRIRIELTGKLDLIGNPIDSIDKNIFDKNIAVISNFRYEKDNVICIDIVVPIYNGNKLLGGIIFRLHPTEFLYPLIQTWPTTSKTSETLLVTKENDYVVYLNELRHQNNTALKLKIKIDSVNSNIPAVMAVMGRDGLVEGRDYRGIPVLAELKRIKDSPWFLVTKVDIDEIYAPLKKQTIIISIIIGLILVSIGIGFIWIWTNSTKSLRIHFLEEESKRKALTKHFEYLIKNANDMVILTSEKRKIVEMNDRALNELGYTKEEITGLDIKELLTPYSHTPIEGILKPNEHGKGISYETEYKRKDGTAFPVDVSGHVLEIEGANYYQRIVRNITERKKAEEELIKSEKRFRTTLDNMIEGCQIIGFDWCYIYINQAAEIHNKRPSKEMIGKNYVEMWPGIENTYVYKCMKSCMDERKVYHFENEFEYPDKGIGWFELSIQPVPEGIFILSVDITERKAAEKERERNQKLLNDLMENSPSIIYMFDIDGKLLAVNNIFEKVVNRKKEEIIGKTRYDFLPKEYADIHRANDLEVVNKKQELNFVEENREADGMHWYYTTKFPLLDNENNVYGVGGISTEFTDQKKAEEIIKESENKYRKLHESLMDGYVMVSMEGNIIDYNEEYRKMLGYRPEEIKKLSYTDITPEKWHSFENEIVQNQILPRGYSEVYQKEYKRKDGTIFPIELRTFLIQNENGENEGMWAIIRDITERKKSENALKLSEEKFSKIFNSSPNGIILTQAEDGKIIDVNPSFINLSGFSKEEMKDVSTLDLNFWVNESDRKQVVEDLLKGNKVYGREIKFRVKEGNEIIFLFSAELITVGEKTFVMSNVADITDRKIMENAIIESENKFRTLFESMNEGVALHELVFDEKGIPVDYRIEEVNPAYEKHTGVLMDSARNQLASEFYGINVPPYLEVYANVALTGKPHYFETYFPPLKKHFDISVFSPKKNWFATVFTDITERKRVEEELKESEYRLRRFYESGLTGVMYWNMDGRIIDANDKFLEMTGYTRDDLINGEIDWLHMTPPEYKELDDKSVIELKTVGVNKIPFEKEYIRKDGSRVPIIIAGAMLDDERYNGVAFVLDITERKEVFNALRESEQRLSFALETNKTGAWELDLIDHTATRTLLHDQIFGYNTLLPEWTYEMFLEHVLPEDRSYVEKRFGEAIANGINWNFECRIKRNDGQVRWIWAIGAHLKNAEGKSIKLSGIVQDITERKEAEEEIRKLNEELEQRVIERTEQLERSNKELESFSYSVSHDLRAPLRSIDGFSLAVYEDYFNKIDDKGKDYIERIRNATKKMDGLIDSLLNLSRVTRFVMTSESVNLSSIANEIKENLVNNTDNKRISEFKIQKNVKVKGDIYLLKILMDNLFSNAWKFSERNEKTIIEFGTIINKSNIIYFIKDNGAGFDMKYYDKLFGAFQRLHSEKDFPGTGIGLATVKRIVARHNGKIWAESEIGKGTTFYFTLNIN